MIPQAANPQNVGQRVHQGGTAGRKKAQDRGPFIAQGWNDEAVGLLVEQAPETERLRSKIPPDTLTVPFFLLHYEEIPSGREAIRARTAASSFQRGVFPERPAGAGAHTRSAGP